METIKASIWGRETELEVIFDLYDGEDLNDAQKLAFECASTRIEVVDSAIGRVARYCQEDETNDSPQSSEMGVGELVTPTTVYIPRDNNGTTFILLCDYALDPEHGLALVFDVDPLQKICSQSDVL